MSIVLQCIPRVGDRVIHSPTSQKFIVSRRTKNRQAGVLDLWNDEAQYPAFECKPLEASTSPLTPSDVVLDSRNGYYASAVKIEGDLVMIEGIWVYGWLESQYLLWVGAGGGKAELVNEPLDFLGEADLITLTAKVEAMCDSGKFELDLLEALSPAQKRQLWDVLDTKQKGLLKNAKQSAAKLNPYGF